MRTVKAILAGLLVALIGTVASCGTMGGGGMRYLEDPSVGTTSIRA